MTPDVDRAPCILKWVYERAVILAGEEERFQLIRSILSVLSKNSRKTPCSGRHHFLAPRPSNLPVDEKHPINPLSQYGISKHTVEHYLYLYGLQYGLNYVVLRYPNVYGPRQNPSGEAGVVAIFANQMLSGEQPTIFGSGDKTRDYTHVSDVMAANLLAVERGNNAIYNIGTGVETSDKEMFDTLAEVLGYSGNPIYVPVRTGEIYRICLNATKAQKELGWQARLSLEEGLLQTVSYYQTRFGQTNL